MTKDANSILITRRIDGFTFRVTAYYFAREDGWRVIAKCENAPHQETREPDEVGNDVWATIQDMLDLAYQTARSHERMVRGPFASEG